MGKHTNVTNKRKSASVLANKNLSFEREKARKARHDINVQEHIENGDYHLTTKAQHDELIVLWNMCKRHKIEVTNECKNEKDFWKASQNIAALRDRLFKNGVNGDLFLRERNIFYKALERKRKNDGNESKI